MEKENLDFDLELDAIDDDFLRPQFNKTWQKTFDAIKDFFEKNIDKKMYYVYSLFRNWERSQFFKKDFLRTFSKKENINGCNWK